MDLKKVSVVCPTFNESENIDELYSRLVNEASKHPHSFEFVFIDNASTDETVVKLESLARGDARLKIIVNETNFGHIRSPFHGILQTDSDATILIAADLQDPPELISDLIDQWSRGYKVVLLTRESSDEGFPIRQIRSTFYSLMRRISDVPLIPNSTGSGLFDRAVVEILRGLREPYPYFRGLVVELGFKVGTVAFHQPLRTRGKTKNNLYTLLDLSLAGFVTHSSVGPRLMTLLGFSTAAIGVFVGLTYLIAKLLFWDSFQLGQAPVLIGIFLFGSIQVFLMGIVGEYLSAIQRRLRDLPLVVEKRRINFE